MANKKVKIKTIRPSAQLPVKIMVTGMIALLIKFH